MISLQGFKDSKNSIHLLLDSEGIDELIDYLTFIKNEDSSFHLNEGNELSNFDDIEDEMFSIPHLKIINLDKI